MTTPPRDGYDDYYTEKLWSWVPEVFRTQDDGPEANGALRALIALVGAQAALSRRDIDRLWEDQAIELCDDWAVPYLGALVGAASPRLSSPRGQRLAAARAIAYARRKGTPAVIDMAIRDIAGVEGVVVEAFRRLARFPHRLDFDVIAHGPVTGSPTAGFARLRPARARALTDGPFDEFAHFPDPRRLRGPLGRFNCRKVNLHLFPWLPVQIDLPTPLEIAPGRFTLDPSGRDVALWQRGQREELRSLTPAPEQMPAPITCRRFNDARYRITAEGLAQIADPLLSEALAPLLGVAFDSAGFWRNVLSRLSPAQRLTFTAALMDATRLPDSPKARLWGDSLLLTEGTEHTAPPLSAAQVTAADLAQWSVALAPHRALAVDPQRGRIIAGPAASGAPVFVNRLHLGVFAPVGAIGLRAGAAALPVADSVLPAGPTGPGGGFTDPGPVAVSLPAPLVGTHRFSTSRSYAPEAPPGGSFDGITEARLDASDGARPYVVFRPDAAALDITFTAAPAGAGPRVLEFDGLWLGILARDLVPEVVADPSDPATPLTARVILAGDFDLVRFHHCTLDPGGERARANPLEAVAIPALQLDLQGQIARLEISRCITGPIFETNAEATLCAPAEIEITDSIVQARAPSAAALRTRAAHVTLRRSTVLGRVEVARLHATDSLIRGRVRVTDTQSGCFRYSATDAEGTVPSPQFESLLVPPQIPRHWLRSTRFGDADFAQLSVTAPEAIRAGAENGAEMGAFNARALGVALEDLDAQLRELLPVGQTPQVIVETDHLLREGSP